MLDRFAKVAAASSVIAIATSAFACSAVLGWNDYTGGVGALGDGGNTEPPGTGDGASDDDGHTIYGVSCGTNKRCAAAPPANWTGPVALYDGPTTDGTPPPCGDGYASAPVYAGNGTLVAPAASCSACTCSAARGETCDAPVVSFYADNACTTACGTPSPLAAGTCAPTSDKCKAFTISPPVPVAATCDPSGGAATIPPVSWSRAARACAPSATPEQGTCNSAELCLPAPASPYEPRFCVQQSGAATACPGAPYTDGPHVFFADTINDSRGCSACTCGASTGAQCTAAGTPQGWRYLDSQCGTTMTLPFSVPTTCNPAAAAGPFKLTGPVTVSAGSCGSAGGAPIGTAMTTGATTFCCTP